MTTLLEIFLLLVILTSFFLAYMIAKSWRIYMVVLGELVLLAAAVFMYMAVRTLKTQKSWREAEIAWSQAVEKQDQKNQELESGREEKIGWSKPASNSSRTSCTTWSRKPA